ncbi:MAG: SLC13 family permease [Acidobacteriota bacterium]
MFGAAGQLFLTLAGVSLLFACLQANGAMEGAAQWVLRWCRGRVALLPLLFFVLAALLAMVGPGAILSVALLAPLAMRTGVPAGIPPFLIALMIGNGANAGNLSPFSSVGVIVHGLLGRGGLGGHELRGWFFHAAAHWVVALAAYALFGGLQLGWRAVAGERRKGERLERAQMISLVALGIWMVGVMGWRWPLGWSALGVAVALLATGQAGWREAAGKMPWRVIALVVTISTGVGLLERAGGLQWFQSAVARWSTPATVHPVLALLTGLISAYSSTSAVVLPVVLPMVPGLAARLPGTDPLALAISVNIGSAMVDVSPLSTLGALCIAAAPEGVDRGRLFTRLMIWGFAMALVAAGICYVGAPWFAA